MQSAATAFGKSGDGASAGFVDSVTVSGQAARRPIRSDALIRSLAALALFVFGSAVQAADLPERVVVRAPIQVQAPCADLDVLASIMDRFAFAEKRTWHRGFIMASLGNGRSSNHPFYEPGLIRRDYCRADAVMTNGSRRNVFFTIEYGQGFASIGNHVDFCVAGLDPWHVHDDFCRTVR